MRRNFWATLRIFDIVFGIALALAASITMLSCSQDGKAGAEQSIVRMNISSEPDSFFPWKSAAADTEALWRNIYEGLMTFDNNGNIIPCLAESVEESGDHLSYTFKLRRGVKFHNGADFTAKDVIWTYENVAGISTAHPTSAQLEMISKIESNGEYEVTVVLKDATPSFLIAATTVILPDGYENHEDQPVGTGPYKFVSYTPNQKVVFEKNDDYWSEEGKAKIKTVEVYIMTDESATISALQSSQLDASISISGANRKSLENEFNLYQNPQNMVQILGMNNTVTPLDDVRVRRAITMAVNKKEIIEGVFSGYATELYTNFSPMLRVYYNDTLQNENPFDVERAKALLKEAGYENGFSMTITVPSNYPLHIDTAQIVSENLKKIGIEVKIELIEWPTWLDQVYTQANYEMTIIGLAGKLGPSDILRYYKSDYSHNFMRFNNREFDSYYDMAFNESDTEKRITYYKECQRVLAQNTPAVFICDPNRSYMTQKNLKGIQFYPIIFHNFATWYFE